MILCLESVALLNPHSEGGHEAHCTAHADEDAQAPSHPKGIPDCCLEKCAKDPDSFVLSSADGITPSTSSVVLAVWDTDSVLNLLAPAAVRPLSVLHKSPGDLAQRPRYALFSTYRI